MIAKTKQTLIRALRFSERYTKTDMVYATKGGVWLTIGQVIAAISAFGIAVGFANLVPAETYGTFKTVFSIAGIVGAFSLTGIGTAIAQAAARGERGALRTGAFAHLRFSKWMLLIGIIVSGYYLLEKNYAVGFGLAAAAFLYPLITSFGFFAGYLKGQRNFKAAATLTSIHAIIPSISVLTSLYLTNDAFTIILVHLISTSLTTLGCYAWTVRTYGSTEKASAVIGLGKHLSVMGAVNRVANELDTIIVFHILGPVAVAVYALAQAPINQIHRLDQIITSLALPKFAQRSFLEIKRALPQKVILLFVLFAVITATYILCAPLLFAFFFPHYSDAAKLSQLIAPVLLFAPVLLLNQALLAHAKVRELYTVDIVTPVARVLLALLFIPTLGLLGGVIVVVGTQGVRSLLLIRALIRAS